MAEPSTHIEGTILLEIQLDGKTLYLSTKYITSTYYYEGIVLNYELMDLSSGARGIGEVSDVSVTLHNATKLNYMTTDTRISETLNNYSWDGRKAILSQYIEGAAGSPNVIFTGTIQNIRFNVSEFKFDIVNDTQFFKELPTTKVSKQAYSDAPAESVGMPIPIVFGQQETYSIGSQLEAKTFFPTVLVNPKTNRYLISSHKVYEDIFPSLIQESFPYMYIPELNHYLWASNTINATYTNNDAGAEFTLADGTLWRLYLRPKELGTVYDVVDEDFSNAVDEDTGTVFTVTVGKKFYLKFGKLPDLGPIDPAELKLVVKVDAVRRTDPPGAGDHANIHYYNADWDAGNTRYSTRSDATTDITAAGTYTFVVGTDISAHGIHDDQDDDEDPWKWSELSKYEFGLTANNSNDEEIDISDIYLWVDKLQFNKTIRGDFRPIPPIRLGLWD